MRRATLQLGALCLAAGCARGPAAEKESSDVFRLKGDRLAIAPQAKFLRHIEVISLGPNETKQVAFQSIGKMIALSNSSNELTGPQTTWAELDESITAEAHLSLKPEPEGTAYGLTSVPAEFLKQIGLHQEVHIKHYKVQETGWRATITRIQPTSDPATVDVLFRVEQGHDLYPGTNCEVTFPLLRTQAVRVPATALLHLGLDEYVWEQTAPNEFAPRKVTLAEANSDEVIVSSGIAPGAKIIGRGAILLKPEIKPLLESEEAHAHEVDRRRP